MGEYEVVKGFKHDGVRFSKNTLVTLLQRGNTFVLTKTVYGGSSQVELNKDQMRDIFRKLRTKKK
jgi:hypothetical protein